MIDELQTRQITALLKDGASAEEIAKELSLEVALVKLVAERNNVGTAADRDINDDELAILRRHAFNLAMGAADDATQARLTMFLLERDKPSKKATEGGSISVINNAIIAANGAFERLVKEMSTPKPIDV